MKLVIGFSTRKTILSWIIRKWQKTPFSHVYLRFGNEVIQASGTSVHSMSYVAFRNKNIIVDEFNIELEDELYKKIHKDALSKIGLPYSYRQLVDIFISDLFGRRSYIFHDRRQAYICSELVAETLKLLEYQSLDLDLDYVTPLYIWHITIMNS